MSGKPYPEGVSEVMKALARLDELNVAIDALHPAAVKACADLKAAQEEHTKLDRSVQDALDSMDLQSQGNMGFGGRMGWFLAEMRRQIVAEIKGQQVLKPRLSITAADIREVLVAGTMRKWDRVCLRKGDWMVPAYEPSSKHSGKQGEIREIAFGPTGGSAIAEHVKVLYIAYTGEVAPKLLAAGTRFWEKEGPVLWSAHELPTAFPVEPIVPSSEFRSVKYDLDPYDLYFGVTGTFVARVEYLSDCDLYASTAVAIYQECPSENHGQVDRGT